MSYPVGVYIPGASGRLPIPWEEDLRGYALQAILRRIAFSFSRRAALRQGINVSVPTGDGTSFTSRPSRIDSQSLLSSSRSSFRGIPVINAGNTTHTSNGAEFSLMSGLTR